MSQTWDVSYFQFAPTQTWDVILSTGYVIGGVGELISPSASNAAPQVWDILFTTLGGNPSQTWDLVFTTTPSSISEALVLEGTGELISAMAETWKYYDVVVTVIDNDNGVSSFLFHNF
jgi:hypothetical protein